MKARLHRPSLLCFSLMLEQDGARIDARAHSPSLDKGVLRSKRAQSSLLFFSFSLSSSFFPSLLACLPVLHVFRMPACTSRLPAFCSASPYRHSPSLHCLAPPCSSCFPTRWSMNAVNTCPEHPWGQGAYGTSPRLVLCCITRAAL